MTNNQKSIKAEFVDEFTCPICLSLISNPLMTQCLHLFCDKCIKKWIPQDHRCPICKKVIDNIKALNAPPIALRNLLLRIERLPSDEEIKCSPVLSANEKLKKIECIELESNVVPMKVPTRANGKPQVIYLI